ILTRRAWMFRNAAQSSGLTSNPRTKTASTGRLNGGLRITRGSAPLDGPTEPEVLIDGESVLIIFTRTMAGQPTGFASSARESLMSSILGCATTRKDSYPQQASPRA